MEDFCFLQFDTIWCETYAMLPKDMWNQLLTESISTLLRDIHLSLGLQIELTGIAIEVITKL